MASLSAKMIKPWLHLAKLAQMQRPAKARRLQERLGRVCRRLDEERVSLLELTLPQCRGMLVEPDELAETRQMLLYLHGGAYTAGGIDYASGIASRIAARTHRRLCCAAYRLAPEHPFPAALEDARDAYCLLLDKGFKPQQIVLIGESAGGGLVFSLCLALKRRGLPLPGRLAAISPWTDLSLSGESVEGNRSADICLTRQELEAYAAAYAPPSLLTPLASPLFGDLRGLPPCRIYAGGDELLRDDATRMALRLRRAGVPCALTVAPGLWHAYVLYGIEEAGQALDEIRAFFLEGCDEAAAER